MDEDDPIGDDSGRASPVVLRLVGADAVSPDQVLGDILGIDGSTGSDGEPLNEAERKHLLNELFPDGLFPVFLHSEEGLVHGKALFGPDFLAHFGVHCRRKHGDKVERVQDLLHRRTGIEELQQMAENRPDIGGVRRYNFSVPEEGHKKMNSEKERAKDKKKG